MKTETNYRSKSEGLTALFFFPPLIFKLLPMQKKPTSAVLSLEYFLDKDIPQTITNLEEMGIKRVCLFFTRDSAMRRWLTTQELRNYLKPLSEDTYLVVKE